MRERVLSGALDRLLQRPLGLGAEGGQVSPWAGRDVSTSHELSARQAASPLGERGCPLAFCAAVVSPPSIQWWPIPAHGLSRARWASPIRGGTGYHGGRWRDMASIAEIIRTSS